MSELKFSSAYTPVFLLIVVLVFFVLFLLLRRTNRDSLSLAQFLPRLLLALLVVLAVGGIYRETIEETSKALLLLDISESMDDSEAEKLLSRARALAEERVDITVIPFSGKSAPANIQVEDLGQFRRVRDAWSKLNVGESNLERAIQAALSEASASILIISDGQENKGNINRLRTALESSPSKIFPLVPDQEVDPNSSFRLSHLHAPLLAAAMKSVEIRTSIRNTTSEPQAGRIMIRHDQKTVLEENVSVLAGQELLVISESDPSTEGIKEIVATLTPDDSSLSPTTLTTYLSGEEREKILLISGVSEDEALFRDVLKQQSYQLDNVVAGPKRIGLPDLKKFSVVIFNNVGMKQLEVGTLRRVEEYVADGGSFMMIGGNRSFGLGGYRDSLMEDILPVKLLPPQTVKKRLNVAVALVIDKSRSMAFGNKIEYAKDAAREVVRNLKDDDYIGVIGFDTTPFIAVPITRLQENRARALSRIGRLFPAGKTNLFPALDEARRNLVRAQAGRKHMIVLTDGKIPDAGPYYTELVRQMRLDGVTVSTVMMGSEADVALLKDMADVGGGAFYQTTNARNLPRIFLSDIRVSTGERTMRERTEYVVKQGPEGVRSTTIKNYPPLRGFVQTAPKRGAALELVTLDLGKAAPLLASWAYRDGRSIAFTSDVNGRWSSHWARWPGFAKFWTELIDSLRPKNEELLEAIPFQLRHYVDRGELKLDLSIFREGVRGAATAELIFPGGASREVTYSSTSYGRYIASVNDVTAGRYELRTKIGERELTPVAFYLSGELFGERKGQGYALPVLSQVAAMSGGKLNPSGEDLKSQVYKTVTREDLTLDLLWLVLLLLLVDILYREVGLSLLRRVLRAADPRRVHRRMTSLVQRKWKKAA